MSPPLRAIGARRELSIGGGRGGQQWYGGPGGGRTHGSFVRAWPDERAVASNKVVRPVHGPGFGPMQSGALDVPGMTRTDGRTWEGKGIPVVARAIHHPCMQVIPAVRARGQRRPLPSIALGMTVGIVLLVGGLIVAYLSLTSGVIGRFLGATRPSSAELATGAFVWAITLVAPLVFIGVGSLRIVSSMTDLGGRRRRLGRVASLDAAAAGDITVAPVVILPDGRRVGELVIGRFGAAVVAELPPRGATRVRHGHWEVRVADGRWLPIENALDRVARDADRVRRWLSDADADHLVKVYAAVLSDDRSIQRTSTCAVISPDQIGDWLAALPPQRGLSGARIDRLVEAVRAAA